MIAGCVASVEGHSYNRQCHQYRRTCTYIAKASRPSKGLLPEDQWRRADRVEKRLDYRYADNAYRHARIVEAVSVTRWPPRSSLPVNVPAAPREIGGAPAVGDDDGAIPKERRR